MARLNCWQVKNCGRQLGGAKAGELGVCSAATELKANGINGGKNGGRACWAVAGTLCGGQVQDSFALKVANCERCNFYQLVCEEEGPNLEKVGKVLQMLK